MGAVKDLFIDLGELFGVKFIKNNRLGIIKNKLAIAEEEVISLNENMKQKFCPMLNKFCIGNDCVHFSKAFVFDEEGDCFGPCSVSPSCKLW